MTDHNRANDLDRIRTLEQAIAHRDALLRTEQALGDLLAAAIRFHGPFMDDGCCDALVAYDEARA